MPRATCLAVVLVILAVTWLQAWGAHPAIPQTQDQKKDDKKAEDKMPKIKVVTDKNNYAKVDLLGGEKLLVKLPCNPTTGYTWVLASKSDSKFVLDGKPVYAANDPKLIGGGGDMKFTFMALAAGDVEVVLHYLRPFEKGREPEKTFSFTARIK